MPQRPFDRAAGRLAPHMIATFGAEARLSAGQRAVAPDQREILAACAPPATLTHNATVRNLVPWRILLRHWEAVLEEDKPVSRLMV